ncbi:MAG: mechanosensitive ion channel family protein, partial [Anaerolineales bacterium]|nr:mechanosensitive ion channel family protein [Anaerolineales bacterium]
WSIILLLALDNLGIEISGLLTGLGIGGIAVALAVQNILSDLLAYVSIMLDRPFTVGDFIVVDDRMGTVERIGLKTTRMRSLSGELLIFANHDLLGSRLSNFQDREDRRVVFTIGVTYDTPAAKLASIPEIMREVVSAQQQVRFDRSHFHSFGDFSLQFETVYYVNSADYGVYMDVQQNINLELVRRFERADIEFAFPTQTVHLAPQPGAG